jgi:tetratricopeptide (TPR) repeat protein
MKKKTTQKKSIKPASVVASRPRFNAWSLSIFVYWFIIIFFIGATFYILGRSHGILQTETPTEISEEILVQPDEYIDAGKTQLISGNIDGRITDLTVAIESDKTATDAFILRGEAYMQSGNYDLALADFNSRIENDPNNSVAFYDRALLFTRLEDYSNALRDINNVLAAITVNPNDILQLRDIYARRGQLNLWLKNWNGRIADYTNSLAHASGLVNPSVYAERAEAFTRLTQYSDAINDYMSAIRVISEQIQGATSGDERESLSRNAMTYFEKSAALNVRTGNMIPAASDLESARTIAAALGDAETVARLDDLINEVNQ